MFIHIPKAAGTSINSYIYNYLEQNNYPIFQWNVRTRRTYPARTGRKTFHPHIKFIKNEYHYLYRTCYKFTIVRNPYDRFVSSFFEQQLTVKKHNLDEKYGRWPGRTFDDYLIKVYNIYKQTGDWYYDMCAPQWQWIDDTVEVLRFENLEEEIKPIKKMFEDKGYFADILNKSPSKPRKKKDYREFYKNSEQVDMVTELYKQELQDYGYEF
jgi:hypothetical protein